MMKCGLGIRPELFEQVLQEKPPLGFLEAHSENYFGDSFVRQKLIELRKHYPISLHGVGLSLGRADDLDEKHLSSLVALVNEISPFIVSEHLAWSAYSHRHIPDLLPLPLTEQALLIMSQHIDRMQQALGRQVLIENPSNYLLFDQLQIPEPEFLNQLTERTGCGLLVDVNNIYVSAINVGRDPVEYLAAIKTDAVMQYHLAGYTEVTRPLGEGVETLLIDTHDHPVYDPVWDLFAKALSMHGARPTLFEWDSDFPEFDVLINECRKADQRLDSSDGLAGKCISELKPVADEMPVGDLDAFQDQFLTDVFGLSSLHDNAIVGQQHRISVYQNNLFGAMQGYLAEVYPATKGVVGDDFFKQMIQVLVQKEPPSAGNVHLYGGDLLAVMVHFEGLSSLPYLADLIRFEWALHSAYYGDLSGLIDPNSVPQQELLTLDVELNKSVSIIESDFPIMEIHRQSLPDYSGEVEVSLDQSSDKLLIFKQHHTVQSESINDDLTSTLKQVQKSQNLMQAIESLTGSIEMNDLSAYLGFILEKQLLVSVSTGSDHKQSSTLNLH